MSYKPTYLRKQATTLRNFFANVLIIHSEMAFGATTLLLKYYSKNNLSFLVYCTHQWQKRGPCDCLIIYNPILMYIVLTKYKLDFYISMWPKCYMNYIIRTFY